MRASAAAIFATLAVFAAARPARAQDPRPPVHPYELHAGQRVRIWTTEGAATRPDHDAVVTAGDERGLAVVIAGRAEVIPFEQMSRLHVRRGWRHLRGAAVAGVLIGAGVGLAVAESGRGRPDDWHRGRNALYGGAIGGTLGALGAAALFPARWYPVSLDALRPPPPVASGPGLSVTIRF